MAAPRTHAEKTRNASLQIRLSITVNRDSALHRHIWWGVTCQHRCRGTEPSIVNKVSKIARWFSRKFTSAILVGRSPPRQKYSEGEKAVNDCDRQPVRLWRLAGFHGIAPEASKFTPSCLNSASHRKRDSNGIPYFNSIRMLDGPRVAAFYPAILEPHAVRCGASLEFVTKNQGIEDSVKDKSSRACHGTEDGGASSLSIGPGWRHLGSPSCVTWMGRTGSSAPYTAEDQSAAIRFKFTSYFFFFSLQFSPQP